jgi:hypothetical protein
VIWDFVRGRSCRAPIGILVLASGELALRYPIIGIAWLLRERQQRPR